MYTMHYKLTIELKKTTKVIQIIFKIQIYKPSVYC